MATKLFDQQRTSMDGSEYISSLWSRATAGNYPAIAFTCAAPTAPLFIEKISYSKIGAGNIEVFGSSNAVAIGAASNSSEKHFNKRFRVGSNALAIGVTLGSITPAQYGALVFGEDLFTRTALEGVFDFTNSNIYLAPTTKYSPPDVSIILVNVAVAGELFASFEFKQINPTFNDTI